jgi:hypothetical protein
MAKASEKLKPKRAARGLAKAQCLCGAVTMEIDTPAVWAWHDHTPATRSAQGAAYATYVGSWKSKFRITDGADEISTFDDTARKSKRSFCATCGTPVFYERDRAPKMVNIPRALFTGRVGREPRYHVGLAEAAEWEYRGETLSPLKGYPGVMHARPKRKPPEPDFPI